jgi:GcrA cell cycle regulator
MSFLARGIEGLPFAPIVIGGSCRRRTVDDGDHPSPAILAVMALRYGSCRWPIGHPKQEGFCFCSASRAPGKPYCAEHSAWARG